jgi:hypothetical protein
VFFTLSMDQKKTIGTEPGSPRSPREGLLKAIKEGASLKPRMTTTLCVLAVFLSISFCPASVSASDHEREKLLARQKTLHERIEALNREQDFLLFEKTVSAQDSKYLIVKITGRTGQLKYKNRVLRDFEALPQSKHLERLSRGAMTLTEKIEGPSKKKKGMIFGNALLVTAKGGDPAPRVKLPRLVLSKRDFRALYATLEAGAFVYVIR